MIPLADLLRDAKKMHAGARAMCRWLCFKYPWFADYIAPTLEPPPELWDDYGQPSSGKVDEVLNHIALYVLHLSTPLPSKGLEPVRLSLAESKPIKKPQALTLFELRNAYNH
jgi:hypothetical protein